MNRFTEKRRFMAASAAMTAALAVAAGMTMAVQAGEDGYSKFKLSGVVTDCVVPRIAAGAPSGAASAVGAAGGKTMTDEEAIAAYRCARSAIVAAYSKSGNAHARNYSTWTVYSNAPYVSATHGNRYVNNYANPAGAEYGKFEEGTELPAGSVLAKDSMVVNDKGQVVVGVLSLMEKMKPGFNTKFGDWRYTMILPDGTVFGETGGAGSQKVAFCAGCHIAVAETQGSLFFVPQDYRSDDRGR